MVYPTLPPLFGESTCQISATLACAHAGPYLVLIGFGQDVIGCHEAKGYMKESPRIRFKANRKRSHYLYEIRHLMGEG